MVRFSSIGHSLLNALSTSVCCTLLSGVRSSSVTFLKAYFILADLAHWELFVGSPYKRRLTNAWIHLNPFPTTLLDFFLQRINLH